MVLAGGDRIASMRRVPVIDLALIALVLLIVASPLLRRLPSPISPANAIGREIRLQVASGGGYLLDGRPVNQVELANALRQARTAAPDLRLRIATADDSDYRGLVGALGAADRAGVRNIASETR